MKKNISSKDLFLFLEKEEKEEKENMKNDSLTSPSKKHFSNKDEIFIKIHQHIKSFSKKLKMFLQSLGKLRIEDNVIFNISIEHDEMNVSFYGIDINTNKIRFVYCLEKDKTPYSEKNKSSISTNIRLGNCQRYILNKASRDIQITFEEDILKYVSLVDEYFSIYY